VVVLRTGLLLVVLGCLHVVNLAALRRLSRPAPAVPAVVERPAHANRFPY
jgi:hypothetical protein